MFLLLVGIATILNQLELLLADVADGLLFGHVSLLVR